MTNTAFYEVILENSNLFSPIVRDFWKIFGKTAHAEERKEVLGKNPTND